MLVRFTLANYKVFRERVDWNLTAAADTTREADNSIAFPELGVRLLKSAVVYGANASGKSKLLDGLRFMKDFIRSSATSQPGDAIPVEPFRLNTTSEEAPSEFEVVFVHQGVRYRYGFELTTTRVVAEWLYYRPHTKEIPVFNREGQEFGKLNTSELKGSVAKYIKEGNVRENALALSLITQLYQQPVAAAVLAWFGKLKLLSGLSDTGYRSFSMNQAMKPAHKQAILSLLQGADLGIEDIAIKQLELDDLPPGLPAEAREQLQKLVAENKDATIYSDVLTSHPRYDADLQVAGTVRLSMQREESAGTRKFFSLTGPILDVLAAGHVLAVDELDSRLHPNLVCRLVTLFNSAEHNPHGAQLLFNTHDTNLLAQGNFRRDQIWFTEKDRYGAATLYSLAEFKGVRKTDNLEANYIQGKYGAIPYLGNFQLLPTATVAAAHGHQA